MSDTPDALKALAELVALEADGKHADECSIEAWERARAALQPTQGAQPVGEVVVTKNEQGQIVAVTRQDADGRVLSVIAESTPTPAPASAKVADGGGELAEFISSLSGLKRKYGEVGSRDCDITAWNEKIDRLLAAVGEAAAEGWVLVPKEFIQGFHTLAHNYSLRAEPPVFYYGTERDAFSRAFRECGEALGRLRAMLSAAPQPTKGGGA
jgi:hypothetical protein